MKIKWRNFVLAHLIVVSSLHGKEFICHVAQVLNTAPAAIRDKEKGVFGRSIPFGYRTNHILSKKAPDDCARWTDLAK